MNSNILMQKKKTRHNYLDGPKKRIRIRESVVQKR